MLNNSADSLARGYPQRSKKNYPIVSGFRDCMCTLRAFPTLFLKVAIPLLGLPLVHLAQICNAAVGPLTMATPLAASNWFPPKERDTATSVAILANNLGAAFGFFAPYVIRGKSKITIILWIHLALSCSLNPYINIFPSKTTNTTVC